MKAPSEEIYRKSTICDFLLIVNSNLIVAILLTVCEIFSRIEVENRHFRLLYCGCRSPSGGTSNNINVVYTSLIVHLVSFNFVADNAGLIFIRLAAVACEITRNFEKIPTSWHFSVIQGDKILVPIESAYEAF